MSPTFASLSIPNYRLWFAGALVSNVGTWMGRVAQDWLVLTQLTDHSSSALGLVTGLQFLPFLFAPLAGTLVDRVPKRQLLLVTQVLLALTSLFTAALVVTGAAQLWMVYLLAFTQGCITAVDNPARQAFVSEMVDPAHLPNAVALNSASFNLGRLLGPAAAGLVIAWFGIWQAFVINGVSFVFVLVALSRMNGRDLHPAPVARGSGQLRAGLAYVRGRTDILLILLLVFVLGTFGLNFQVTNALMATRVFGKGSQEFGLLGTVMAIGSLSAALMSARRARPRLRVLLGALVVFTVSILGLALAPSYAAFAVLLVPAGWAALTAMTTANAMVQVSAAPQMRGRVMAIYMAVFSGGTPVGAPLIGWIGDAFGPRWALVVGGLVVGLTVAVVGLWLVRRDNVRVSHDPENRWHLRVVVGGQTPTVPVRAATSIPSEALR